jgi:outer membrane protein TolC
MIPFRSSRVVAAALTFGILAAPASAGAAGLTLQDALRIALSHNASVAKQQAALAQAQEQYVKQRSTSLPNVTGMLQNYAQKSANLQGNFAIAGLSQQQTFSQNTAQIGTNYTLDTGGLAFLQADSAKAQMKAAQADLRNTQAQLVNDVTSRYYTIAVRDETVRLDEADVRYQHVLVQIAQAKERAGVAAGVDVLRAQASESKSRSTLAADKASSHNAREELAQFIGAPLEADFNVPQQVAQPAMPAQPLDRLIAIAQNARPDVASAQYSLASAQITRRGWGRELFPQVQLSAAFGNQFSPTAVNFEGPTPRGAPGFWQLQAISTFSLPLVDYGARHAERVNDDAQILAAQNALQTVSSQVAVDVREAYRGAQTAQAQLGYTNDEVRAGVEAARIARLQYEHGIIAINDVLQAQQSALSSQFDLYSARVNYVEAIVKLRVALGVYDPTAAVADLKP